MKIRHGIFFTTAMMLALCLSGCGAGTEKTDNSTHSAAEIVRENAYADCTEDDCRDGDCRHCEDDGCDDGQRDSDDCEEGDCDENGNCRDGDCRDGNCRHARREKPTGMRRHRRGKCAPFPRPEHGSN